MNETIAAIATPQAAGGISVIRISGDNAFAVADSVFRPVSGRKLAEYKGYTAAYGIFSAAMTAMNWMMELQPSSVRRTAIPEKTSWRSPVMAAC